MIRLTTVIFKTTLYGLNVEASQINVEFNKLPTEGINRGVQGWNFAASAGMFDFDKL